MSFLAFLISGFFIGLIARALKPGNDGMGLLFTTLLGMTGAVVAGFLGQAMGFYAPGEPVGWIASIFGATLVLVVGHALFGRRRSI